ncbi:glycine--tRNA ligase subunit beta [Peptostreptococcus anaerobius]|uniref:glycine--tRNA ligase subunit beta n=1 Tax=Peptostreptococcus anaerobius TaxID=1261 RepID=UPI00232E9A28|nr:glycine--tRNA ligase subunit beta [Peptostreptococcus anaerobius]MDB8821343.1 glycine--tRNA ligase subunit beta [Peptostreptococcus anaerobius]MDB8826011.1 glycine--tRNA ligase subunit beta [Peptostreptococcus anaerobius]MDB8827828.1 glycine--tRNA ligase subunit beta [Peptostreptococcus anaerobius]MDB8829645.1 glycine--tRNA ligase subunit beta [Peptostreptococcus anaerobius]MDB8831508.1 glycine--tRNA ligase subunit beta [Peptostreptococcus anaerobius]
MNNYLLYEIGVEEMPSRFVQSTLDQLVSGLKSRLEEKRVAFEDIDTFATPRRLILVVKGLADRQADLEEEVKGPAKKISIAEDGSFTKAAQGFMRGKGLSESDVYFKDLNGTEYIFATIREEGKDTDEVLMEVLPEIVKSVVFPKSMRWGGKNMRFVRPIRWLVALHNDKVVPVDLEGIIASNVTVGHRFLGSKSIEVSSIEDYFKKLEENFVVYDQDLRKDMIRKQIDQVAASIGGKVEMDEELLDEVTYIVEYPTAFYGEFDKSYTELPKEVVKTPMKAHQRYFPVVGEDSNLLPYFIAVRNGNDYKIENVKAGNEKVLEARLADAKFFFNEDRQHDLEYYRNKLNTVVFQEKLGTLLDKSERIYNIAKVYGKEVDVNIEDLESAAYYAKADLVTNMVFEFDELQGYMGMQYSRLEGNNDTVSKAIYEHYMPRFNGDTVPSTMEGAILSIIDKMDTIAGFFAIGIQPTGSADPFALRRQCIGILTILLEKNIEIDVARLASISLDQYSSVEFDKDSVIDNIIEFFNERTKNMFKDMGIRYDVVEAVLASDEKNISDLYVRAEAMNKWIDRDSLTDMLVAFNRVSNLAEGAETDKIDQALLLEDVEKELYDNFKDVDSKISDLMDQKEYTKSLDAFASLKPAVDNFFDNVMVMSDNPKLRTNRLALLKNISDSMLKVCDLTKIVYK